MSDALLASGAPGRLKDGSSPQCSYCKNRSTGYVLHAEGMAYIPFCADHEGQAIDDAEHSTPDGSHDPSNVDRVGSYASQEFHDYTPLGPGKLWNLPKGVGLPPMIRDVAHALERSGHPESTAIAIAVGAVKHWASGGGKVKPGTRAKAAAAVAQFEALRAAAHGKSAAHKVGKAASSKHAMTHDRTMARWSALATLLASGATQSFSYNPLELRDSQGRWIESPTSLLKKLDGFLTSHKALSKEEVLGALDDHGEALGLGKGVASQAYGDLSSDINDFNAAMEAGDVAAAAKHAAAARARVWDLLDVTGDLAKQPELNSDLKAMSTSLGKLSKPVELESIVQESNNQAITGPEPSKADLPSFEKPKKWFEEGAAPEPNFDDLPSGNVKIKDLNDELENGPDAAPTPVPGTNGALQPGDTIKHPLTGWPLNITDVSPSQASPQHVQITGTGPQGEPSVVDLLKDAPAEKSVALPMPDEEPAVPDVAAPPPPVAEKPLAGGLVPAAYSMPGQVVQAKTLMPGDVISHPRFGEGAQVLSVDTAPNGKTKRITYADPSGKITTRSLEPNWKVVLHAKGSGQPIDTSGSTPSDKAELDASITGVSASTKLAEKGEVHWETAPKPKAPEAPVPPQPLGPKAFAEWLVKVKKRYADFAAKGGANKSTLEQSNNWPKVEAVMNQSDKAALKQLEGDKYLDGDLVAEALKAMKQAQLPEDPAAAAAYKTEAKKYAADQKQYLSDLKQWQLAHGITAELQGMKSGKQFSSNEEGWEWANKNLVVHGDTNSVNNLPDHDGLHGLQAYTNGSYAPWNKALVDNYVSKVPLSAKHQSTFAAVDSKMDTLQQSVVLVRGGEFKELLNQLAGDTPLSEAQVQANPAKLVGRVLHNPAYLSTSVGKTPAFASNPIQLNILATPGTKYSWAEPYTLHHGEREVILGRGANYFVHAAYKSGGKWNVDIEILPPDAKPEDYVGLEPSGLK